MGSDGEKEVVITVIFEYWLKKFFLFFIKSKLRKYVTHI